MPYRVLVVLVLYVAAACGDSPTGSPAATKGGTVGESAALERIVVSATTVGPHRDSDSYTVFVDGQSRGSIGPNGQFVVRYLQPVSHVVGLSGVPENCVMGSPNPRIVTPSQGVAGTADFSVQCWSGATRIRVTTKTQFIPGPYGNGFTVELDGEQHHIDATGTIVFGDVTAGVHVVRLLGLPPGCGFWTSPSYFTRTVNVTSGNEVRVVFSVLCIG